MVSLHRLGTSFHKLQDEASVYHLSLWSNPQGYENYTYTFIQVNFTHVWPNIQEKKFRRRKKNSCEERQGHLESASWCDHLKKEAPIISKPPPLGVLFKLLWGLMAVGHLLPTPTSPRSPVFTGRACTLWGT